MKRTPKIILGGIIGIGAIAAISSVASGGSPDDGHKSIVERAASAAASQKPTGPATSFGDGTRKVGPDIAAGTYKTDGESHGFGDQSCYWARSRNDSGELNAIIANDFSNGPMRFTVRTGEVVQTSGGCEWKLVR